MARTVDTTNSTNKNRLRIIRLASEMSGQMIKKVQMWSLFIMQLIILFTAHHTDIVHIVQPTGTVQPQAYPMMLLVFAYYTVHYTLIL